MHLIVAIIKFKNFKLSLIIRPFSENFILQKFAGCSHNYDMLPLPVFYSLMFGGITELILMN